MTTLLHHAVPTFQHPQYLQQQSPPLKQPPSKTGQAGQLAPIPVTNPTNRVGRYGGEGGAGEQEGKQSSRGAKKSRAAFMGDSPHPPHRPNEAGEALPSRASVNLNDDDNDVFTDHSRTLHNEWKARERRIVATAPVKKKWRASNPYCPGCCGTLLFSSLCHQYPKDLP